LFRLRLAYADIAADSWSLRIGEDWDAFITVIPKSVNFTFFGEQGSPGYRRPQIWGQKVVDLGVCKMTALRMLRRGDVKGRQVCAGAPWVIKAEDVAAFAARKRSAGPVTPNPAQPTFEFQ
jgi:hypothetical protein